MSKDDGNVFEAIKQWGLILKVEHSGIDEAAKMYDVEKPQQAYKNVWKMKRKRIPQQPNTSNQGGGDVFCYICGKNGHKAKDCCGVGCYECGLPVTIRLLDPPLHEFLLEDDLGVVNDTLESIFVDLGFHGDIWLNVSVNVQMDVLHLIEKNYATTKVEENYLDSQFSSLFNNLGLVVSKLKLSDDLGLGIKLSVAILLIGDPNVVYTDEPNTGLDPASRNNLWRINKIVQLFSQGTANKDIKPVDWSDNVALFLAAVISSALTSDNLSSLLQNGQVALPGGRTGEGDTYDIRTSLKEVEKSKDVILIIRELPDEHAEITLEYYASDSMLMLQIYAARASGTGNQDAIDAAIVGTLADPKEVTYPSNHGVYEKGINEICNDIAVSHNLG
ncbi:ABC transporter A family member 7 [Artemisia annua]|uniref:ABC transporter A family member 7 n=1 Tax=Artemisia annua TaxID=35608 RepID=A0A2U1KPS8_ARTAN|nr:ABC transporter A family member 7 [Artemisia annua]